MKSKSMPQRRSTASAVCLGVALFLLAGCASTTRIDQLLSDPGRYNGRTVRVEGTVTRAAGVLGVGAYEVDDGTGSIVVISRGQGVPSQGSRTRVRGTFESVFSFMGRTIAAIMQSEQDTR